MGGPVTERGGSAVPEGVPWGAKGIVQNRTYPLKKICLPRVNGSSGAKF